MHVKYQFFFSLSSLVETAQMFTSQVAMKQSERGYNADDWRQFACLQVPQQIWSILF